MFHGIKTMTNMEENKMKEEEDKVGKILPFLKAAL